MHYLCPMNNAPGASPKKKRKKKRKESSETHVQTVDAIQMLTQNMKRIKKFRQKCKTDLLTFSFFSFQFSNFQFCHFSSLTFNFSQCRTPLELS